MSLADSLDHLDAALAANDHPRALSAAVAAWRDTRSVELADLVDRIGERCGLVKPPHTRRAMHRWWMEHALRPDLDAVTVGALLATFPIRMQVDTEVPWSAMRARWTEPHPVIAAIADEPIPPWWAQWRTNRGEDPTAWPERVANWVDRLAAVFRWPDDPRVTRLLVDLLANPDVMLYGECNARMARAIADRLIGLADRRAVAWLAKIPVSKPYETYKQRIVMPLVPQITAALAEPAPREPERIAHLLARPAAAPRSPVDHGPLWNEVAEHPDDDAPRLVLADALIAAGDNRGEVIALQCVTDPARSGRAKAQAHALIRTEWTRWMGDLAQLLARKGTEMSRGMLDKIRIGLASTQPWVWESTRGHRELVVVREVRPAHADPFNYARFIAHLPRVPRFVTFDAPEAIAELAKHRTSFPIAEAYYASTSSLVYYGRTRPTFEQTFTTFARLAPTLEQLELGALWWMGGEYQAASQLQPAEYVAMLEQLPRLFPKLRSLRISQSHIPEHARSTVATLASRGFELVDNVWRWPKT